MTPVEQEHIVRAYTFELGKCYEQAVKERQLRALANIDATLCAEVAAGLGLPAPEADVEVVGSEPSPALSQVGGTWPADGRVVALVVDPDGDLASLPGVRRSLLAAGVLPLVVAPVGGLLPDGTAVQRTFLTTRSVEFDAVVLLGSPAPAADALPARDAKAGAAVETIAVDPRVSLLLDEVFRHCKAIAGVGAGAALLDALGYTGSAGVVSAEEPDDVVEELLTLMGSHRVWERFRAAVGATVG
jgi:catalase